MQILSPLFRMVILNGSLKKNKLAIMLILLYFYWPRLLSLGLQSVVRKASQQYCSKQFKRIFFKKRKRKILNMRIHKNIEKNHLSLRHQPGSYQPSNHLPHALGTPHPRTYPSQNYSQCLTAPQQMFSRQICMETVP